MTLQSYVGARITREGRQALESTILQQSGQLRESSRVNGDRNARGCGCSTNATMADDVTRQHNTKRTLLRGLKQLKDEATVVDTPTSCEVLGIDLVGVFRLNALNADGSVSHTEPRVIHVVGYNEGDCEAVPQRLSYLAPLVAPFMGQRVGWSEDVTLRGVEYEMVLDEITFPNTL